MAEKITLIVQLKDGVSKISGRMGKALKTVKQHWIGFTVAVAAAVIAIRKVTKAASDLEEVQSKFNTVFRGSTELAEENSRILQQAFLMSETAAKKNLAAIQDLLVPMGVARDRATEFSFEIVKLAADLGSFNNLPTEKVMIDIQAALSGSFETMKKYGVVLRASEIEQKILNDGIRKTKSEITQADRVMAAYQLILAGTADAQGDVARTSESMANKSKLLNSRIEDMMTAMGELTIGPMSKFVGFMTTLVEKTTQFIEDLQWANENLGAFGLQLQIAALEAINFRGILDEKIASLQKLAVESAKTSGIVVAAEKKKTKAIKDSEKIIRDEKKKTGVVAEFVSSRISSSFGSNMAQVLVDNKKFSDAMKDVWKDLARAIITEITKAIAKALILKALTGSFTGGAGATSLFGLKKGGAVGLAGGGIVRSRAGGTSAIIGEGGRSEAIVPLNDPRTKRLLGDTFGGGEGNGIQFGDININVEIASISPESADEVMEKISSELASESQKAIRLALEVKKSQDRHGDIAV